MLLVHWLLSRVRDIHLSFAFAALGAFYFLALVEGIILSFLPSGYNWKSYAISVTDRAIAATQIFSIPLWGLVLVYFYDHRLLHFKLATAWQIAILFAGEELCYYWFHRASHRIRWFWATHAVHHSPNELNFGAAYRLGLTGSLSGTILFYAPMAYVGFDPKSVGTVLSLNIFYQLWIHSTWIPKLGPLEYVLNTPSHHRVHHARQLEYLDSNYGGVLILFDRLFGTFVKERADVPCDYGLVRRITTYNPLTVEFHVWWAMAQDIWECRSIRHAIGYVFGPPGWAPNGSGATTEDLRRRQHSLAG